MTVTKNVYVLMLALVIVLSGCIGGTADGQDEGDCGESTEDCTTVIHNHYYNNTTNVLQNEPELKYRNGNFTYSSEYNKGEYVVVDRGGGTTSASWVGTPAQWVDVTTINQNEGEALRLEQIQVWANVNFTNCEENHSGASTCDQYGDETRMFNGLFGSGEYFEQGIQWLVSCSEGIEISSGSSGPGATYAFGSNCDYTLQWKSTFNADIVFWSISYTVEEAVEG